MRTPRGAAVARLDRSRMPFAQGCGSRARPRRHSRDRLVAAAFRQVLRRSSTRSRITGQIAQRQPLRRAARTPSVCVGGEVLVDGKGGCFGSGIERLAFAKLEALPIRASPGCACSLRPKSRGEDPVPRNGFLARRPVSTGIRSRCRGHRQADGKRIARESSSASPSATCPCPRCVR